jgi:hypothetical protein
MRGGDTHMRSPRDNCADGIAFGFAGVSEYPSPAILLHSAKIKYGHPET